MVILPLVLIAALGQAACWFGLRSKNDVLALADMPGDHEAFDPVDDPEQDHAEQRENDQGCKHRRQVEGDVSPRVSEHLPEILAIIQKLMDQGRGLRGQGDVYFQVSRYPEYAQAVASATSTTCARASGCTPGEQKREPLDFALWKAAKPGEPSPGTARGARAGRAGTSSARR